MFGSDNHVPLIGLPHYPESAEQCPTSQIRAFFLRVYLFGHSHRISELRHTLLLKMSRVFVFNYRTEKGELSGYYDTATGCQGGTWNTSSAQGRL